jgi:hypothetical protein
LRHGDTYEFDNRWSPILSIALDNGSEFRDRHCVYLDCKQRSMKILVLLLTERIKPAGEPIQKAVSANTNQNEWCAS